MHCRIVWIPPTPTPLQPNVTYHSVVTPSFGGRVGEKGEARFLALWEYSAPPPPTLNINSKTFSKGSQNITFNPVAYICLQSANLTWQYSHSRHKSFGCCCCLLAFRSTYGLTFTYCGVLPNSQGESQFCLARPVSGTIVGIKWTMIMMKMIACAGLAQR